MNDSTQRRAPSNDHKAVAAGVFYALFKVVQTSELAGPKRALDWAQSALDDPQLLDALAAGAREHPDPKRPTFLSVGQRYSRDVINA